MSIKVHDVEMGSTVDEARRHQHLVKRNIAEAEASGDVCRASRLRDIFEKLLAIDLDDYSI